MDTTLKPWPKVRVASAAIGEFLEFAIEAVGDAGQVIGAHFRESLSVDNKLDDGRFDPVTIADREGERSIREAIERRFPAHGIFGEEHGHKEGNGLTWVIDPIDGTRAFMTGMIHWGVLLALYDGEEPIVGVMHQPFTGEYFFGDNVSATYRRGAESRPLRCRPCTALQDAVLTATSPEFFREPGDLEAFERLQGRVRLTRFGGDCYLFAMLAMGHVDLGVEAMLHPYDIQALIPIIRGAGGVVSTWAGENPSLGGRVLASGDEALHEQALAVLGG